MGTDNSATLAAVLILLLVFGALPLWLFAMRAWAKVQRKHGGMNHYQRRSAILSLRLAKRRRNRKGSADMRRASPSRLEEEMRNDAHQRLGL
ncbi:MAG: hypothetical protein GY906_38575 [bacterium]|nr:hypothetical protein [bacterium]